MIRDKDEWSRLGPRLRGSLLARAHRDALAEAAKRNARIPRITPPVWTWDRSLDAVLATARPATLRRAPRTRRG